MKVFSASFLLFFALFFAGCGTSDAGLPSSESSSALEGSPPTEISEEAVPSSQADLSVSLSEEGKMPPPSASFQSPYDMTYEEYFSQERYWNSNGGWSILYAVEGDTIYRRYLVDGMREVKEREVYYQHTGPIQSALFRDRYLLYFLSEGSVYRFFIPEKTVEKIYTNDRILRVIPLTNFAFVYVVYNPENDQYDPEIGGPSVEDFYYLYSQTKGINQQIFEEDYGYPNFRNLFSYEEGPKALYPLPE